MYWAKCFTFYLRLDYKGADTFVNCGPEDALNKAVEIKGEK